MPELCQPCRANNCGNCECDLSGNCKSLMHEAATAADVRGDPRHFLDGELFRFADLVRRAIAISPLDTHGFPTLQALSWIDIETPYSTKTTQNLAYMLLSDLFPKK